MFTPLTARSVLLTTSPFFAITFTFGLPASLDRLIPGTGFSKDLMSTYAFTESNTKPNVLQYLKRNEFFAHMQRTLKKVDLMSMANSLEVRVPFLDKRTIRFSNTLIPNLGITHSRPKLVLKDDLYQFIDIKMVNKQKQGFSVPVEKWLRNELKEDFERAVIHTPIFGAAYLDTEFLYTLVSDFYERKAKVDPWGLWHLYAWQKWAINNKLI